jgi:hypothetical protein
MLGAFEQGGIFLVPHLLRHEASVFLVSSEGPPHPVASYPVRIRVRIDPPHPPVLWHSTISQIKLS